MGLKAAFGWSLLFHAGLLTLQLPGGINHFSDSKPLSVTFVSSAPSPSVAARKEAPPPAEIKRQPAPAPKSREEPPAILRRSLPEKPPTPRPPPPVTEPKAKNQAPSVSEVRPEPRPLAAAQPQVAAAIGGRTTNPSGRVSSVQWLSGPFLSLEHKEKVRAHLKERLTFPSAWIRGSVRLRLTLEPEGRLAKARVLEASDPRLAQAALTDTEKAAPFPTFSSEISQQNLQYDFLIRYEPD